MKTINQKTFKELVFLCKEYDPFTNYIESYEQEVQAEKYNKAVCKRFSEIMESLGISVKYIPWSCENKGKETEAKLTEYLAEHDITIAKRVWTEEEIKNLIQTNDTVLYRALKQLYACQTADEQSVGDTVENNGVGFNGADAKILSSMAKFLIQTNFLTPKQKVIVRKKLVKYNKQLTRLANKEVKNV